MSKRKTTETPDQRLARLRAAGLKGGLTTKRRMLAANPYYSALGRIGSATRIATKIKAQASKEEDK